MAEARVTRNAHIDDSLFQDMLQGYLETGKERKLKIMVIGEAGQGKSTLINLLVGNVVSADDGVDCLDAGTRSVNQHNLDVNGVNVTIMDTPGFGMGNEQEDSEIIETLALVDGFDLVLFCVRMDCTRFPTNLHSKTVDKLTSVFGKQLWQHCLLVLTFANNLDELCPHETEMGKYFSHRLYMFQTQFQELLKTRIPELSPEEVHVVPVGSKQPSCKNCWALPDREDWFNAFWNEAACSINTSAVPSILQVNYHRLKAFPKNCLATSPSNFPPPPFEPSDRLIEIPENVLTDINKAVDKSINVDRPMLDVTLVNQQVSENRGIKEPNSDYQQQDGEIPSTVDEDSQQDIHNREIEWYYIIANELHKKDSGICEYIKEFAMHRGNEVFGFGHVGGLVEGLIEYIDGFKQRKKYKKENHTEMNTIN